MIVRIALLRIIYFNIGGEIGTRNSTFSFGKPKYTFFFLLIVMAHMESFFRTLGHFSTVLLVKGERYFQQLIFFITALQSMSAVFTRYSHSFTSSAQFPQIFQLQQSTAIAKRPIRTIISVLQTTTSTRHLDNHKFIGSAISIF